MRRRAIRAGLLFSNLIVLGGILFFVLQNHSSSLAPASSVINKSTPAAVTNPLDEVSSAEIAQTVAQMNALPETVAISNQAQSQAADIAIASTDSNVVISKPQVVATALKSRADIKQYVSQAGDSLGSLAAKFGVTSNSIRWSNNLSATAAIPVGTKLVIPPVNGIVYTVKSGDTAASLAVAYGSSADQIIEYNDAETAGLQPGEQIIIPNGSINTVSAAPVSLSTSFPWGSGPMYGYNGYDYGYCTWYVATQISVPANWGNASSWAYYAALSGWHVSKTPTVGSIAQKGGGEGHVAIVNAVNPDGTITVRDMNGFAGWGRVGVGTVPVSFFQNFITH